MNGWRAEKRIVVGAFLVMSAALLGTCVWMFVLTPIPSHRGDGQFQDTSHRVGPLPIRGYTISMPEFDLGEAHQAEYHVAGLTNIGQDCGVYLAFHDPNDKRFFGGEWRNLEGKLRLELLDSRGSIVVATSGRLADYTWYEELGASHHLVALYQLDKSYFRPNRRDEYLLRISYVPEPRLKGYKGFAYLRCTESI
jgi:hypothetical protein